ARSLLVNLLEEEASMFSQLKFWPAPTPVQNVISKEPERVPPPTSKARRSPKKAAAPVETTEEHDIRLFSRQQVLRADGLDRELTEVKKRLAETKHQLAATRTALEEIAAGVKSPADFAKKALARII